MARLTSLLALLLAGWVALSAQQTGGVSQLVWFDRAGQRLGDLGSFGDIGNLELSPDDRQVAVALTDGATGTRDLWIYDVDSGERRRFTDDRADENWLVWSPDANRVAFNSFGITLDLYASSPDGAGVPDLLWRNVDAMWPVSWSSDGDWLLVVTNSVGTGNDIWALPLAGGDPEPLFATPLAENWAAFSPDGRWIAYSSSDTGQAEVYVTPFPITGQRWQVSSGGGSATRWRDDGGELYFVSPDRWLQAVEVDGSGDGFVVGPRERLFETRFPYPPFHSFDVTSDGQRFLVNTAVASPTTPGVSASLTVPPGRPGG